MLLHVALVRTNVSEELSPSIIRVTKIGELGTRVMEALSSSETSVLTRATRRNIPEDAILPIHSVRRKEDLPISGILLYQFTKRAIKLAVLIAWDITAVAVGLERGPLSPCEDK
jgi:hypothetical protein